MRRLNGVRCSVLGVGYSVFGSNSEHRTPNTPSVVLALCVVLASPAAAINAVALFRQGEQAERTTRYSGVKVIWACRDAAAEKHPDYQRSARIWHDGPGRTRLEILGADGKLAHVIVENGSQRWFYSARHHTWRPVAWRPPKPRLDLLLRNYRIVRGPVESVAGRRALEVRLQPRYGGGPRKQSWLDAATGITLRADLYDRSGRLVSRSEFRQFTPERALDGALFTIPASAAEIGRHSHPGARLQGGRPEQVTALASDLPAGFETALPHYLPRGFVLDRVTRLSAEGVVRAVFTDGLNTLLLIEWQGARAPEDAVRTRFWGPTERRQWSLGSIHALLAGDLPAAELERVARSVRPGRTRAGSLVTRK